MGVNHRNIIPEASYRIQCLSYDQLPGAPVLVIHQSFRHRESMMTTVHSYTNDQRILDLLIKIFAVPVPRQ